MLSASIRRSINRVPVRAGNSMFIHSFRSISSKPSSSKDGESAVSSTTAAIKNQKSISAFPKKRSSKVTASASASASQASSSELNASSVEESVPKSTGRSKGSKKITDHNKNKILNSSTNTAASPIPSYLPYSALPKPPQSVLDKSLSELCTEMGFGGADVSPTVEFHELTDTEAKVKGFEIPDLYLKSKMDGLVTDIDRQIVDEIDNILELDNDVEIAQSQMKIVKLYYDQESNKLKEVPVHSFKTSLSGMINLNPAMDEIDDDYLWQIFPRGKLFGSLPSDTHEEIKMKEEEIQKAKENNEEFIEWKESLTDSKSLYVKAGSRRKVDRKSARNFKKLDKEDKIPKANFVVIKHGWDKK